MVGSIPADSQASPAASAARWSPWACPGPIRNREFLGFRGTVGGVPIGVCSTGIGGPLGLDRPRGAGQCHRLVDAAAAMGEKPLVGIATTRDAFPRKDQALGELPIRWPASLPRGDARATSPLEPPFAGTGAGGSGAGDRLGYSPAAEGAGGGASPLPRGGGTGRSGSRLAVQLLAERDEAQGPSGRRFTG